MPEIQIHDVRLSFIWVETVLDLLGDIPAPSAPFPFLGDRVSYGQRFDQALQGDPGPEDLQKPWRGLGKQFFWIYYLEGRTPDHLTGDQAWKALVPFRRKVPATLQAPWLPKQISLEGFFYPFGLAWVLTARYCDQLSLEQLAEEAFKIRRTGRFQVKWASGGSSQDVSLDRFGDKALNALRQIALGPGTVPGSRQIKPFTVVTIVRGAGVDPSVPVPDGGEIHRTLEAMTSWRPSWRYDTLPHLAEASLPIQTAPPGHVLYGRSRGRAVWFPGLFIQTAGDFHSLACYHRNLLFVSLQVDSLAKLASVTAELLRQGSVLSSAHRECARRAVGILGLLYTGHTSTYRSWSPRAHIEQNNLVADVNQVRQYFNLPLLH